MAWTPESGVVLNVSKQSSLPGEFSSAEGVLWDAGQTHWDIGVNGVAQTAWDVVPYVTNWTKQGAI